MGSHFKIRIIFFCVALIAAASLRAEPPPKKAVVPSPDVQQGATKLIKDVYGDEWAAAKTSAQKETLAKKLISKAGEPGNDPAATFVLLKIATDIATQAGDVDDALAAIDEMDKTFKFDALGMKAAALTKLAVALKTQDQHKGLAETASALSDEIAVKGEYDVADKMAELAASEARRSKDGLLVRKAEDHKAEIEKQAKLFEDAKEALGTLEKDPTDADANLTIGKYSCFVEGDWKGGLAHLAKGSDEALKAAAELELKVAVTPDEQARLGDAWWNAADKQDATTKMHVRGHAGFWYRQAIPGLTGLVKDKAEKRLKELAPRGVFAETVVIWNTHNATHRDRGTTALNVILRAAQKTVWRKTNVPIKWDGNIDPKVVVELPYIQFDAVRIEITKYVDAGGGLSEVEVFSGGKNIARGLPATASASFPPDRGEDFQPSNITDGVEQSTRYSDYWLLPDRSTGWIEISFAPAK